MPKLQIDPKDRTDNQVSTQTYLTQLRNHAAWWTGQHSTDPRYLATYKYLRLA